MARGGLGIPLQQVGLSLGDFENTDRRVSDVHQVVFIQARSGAVGVKIPKNVQFLPRGAVPKHAPITCLTDRVDHVFTNVEIGLPGIFRPGKQSPEEGTYRITAWAAAAVDRPK